MKRFGRFGLVHARLLALLAISFLALVSLLVYKLGSLVGGLSLHEARTATTAVGWSGIYHQPFYLPLLLVRSVVFFIWSDHGQTLTRLPNVLFGGTVIIMFGWLMREWYGQRIALFSTLLFATSAWVLHVSRLASFDVAYLGVLPTLLLIQVLLRYYATSTVVWYASLIAAGLLLYIPGVIWLVGLQAVLQRKLFVRGWRQFASVRQRVITGAIPMILLPLLIINLARSGQFKLWLGLPAHLASPLTLMKQLFGVPIHLFLRGPEYPEVWLGRLPILDVFCLVTSLLGIYFYARHAKAARSRSIAWLFGISSLLIAVGGPVSLSLLVPLMYLLVATGLAYLLRDWLTVFPLNPLARGAGIGLIAVVVATSCIYNIRSYFIAWPHNTVTRTTFSYHRD